MKNLSLFLLFVISGCAMFSPPSPSAESYAVKASWLGGDIADLKSVMGRPVSQQPLSDGVQKYYWRSEKTVTGPPRHEFGPKGRIKTRPGTVDYYYCDTFVTADADGRIASLEFQGKGPASLLPPSRISIRLGPKLPSQIPFES